MNSYVSKVENFASCGTSMNGNNRQLALTTNLGKLAFD